MPKGIYEDTYEKLRYKVESEEKSRGWLIPLFVKCHFSYFTQNR